MPASGFLISHSTSSATHTQARHDRARRLPACASITVAIAVALAGCATGDGAEPANTFSPKLTNVDVVMGYRPDVQFAPFYAAIKQGYYKSAGLNVKFNYTSEPNALQLLSNGSVDFVDSGGDEVLTAGAAGLHVKFVLTQYSRFPSALFFLESSKIKHIADLKGKTIGVPGDYGASYYGLLALLAAGGLTSAQVTIEPIGYTQVSEVASGQVAAAMGYAPNEPVALRSEGKAVGEFDVYHWDNIAGAGIATSNSLIAHKPGLVHAFVAATLRGMRFALAHPGRTFAISKAFIPEFSNPGLQRQVLNRALVFWKPAGVALGRMDPKVWNLTEKILYRFKVISKRVSASAYYTNRFVG
jgi:NitT/TauT family transport system substrate-binding protein